MFPINIFHVLRNSCLLVALATGGIGCSSINSSPDKSITSNGSDHGSHRRNIQSYREMFYQKQAEVKDIYQQYLLNNHNAAGQIKIRLEFDETGVITGCTTFTDNGDLELLAERLCPVFQRLDIGSGEKLTLEYPLDFSRD